MSGKAYSRAERETMIIQTFAIMVQHGEIPLCTATKMARKLGLEPSTHFRSIMNGLVEKGRLESFTVVHRRNRDKKVYKLAHGTYQEPRRRSIPIRAKGVLAAQLELF